jgi:hypothetical protein
MQDLVESVDKSIKSEYLNWNDVSNYKGNYCGNNGVQIRSSKFTDTCATDLDKMSTCATQGVFSNAIYTVYDSKNDRCNTYFDCNNSDSYYQSYKIGSGPSTSYPQYDFPQVAQSKTTTAQYRFETSCPAIDPKVFPPTPDICACPDG